MCVSFGSDNKRPMIVVGFYYNILPFNSITFTLENVTPPNSSVAPHFYVCFQTLLIICLKTDVTEVILPFSYFEGH